MSRELRLEAPNASDVVAVVDGEGRIGMQATDELGWWSTAAGAQASSATIAQPGPDSVVVLG